MLEENSELATIEYMNMIPKRIGFFRLYLFTTVLVCFAAPCTSQGTDVQGDKSVRIICMAPNLTEILFELGAGPQIIGVSDFDSFPPEVGNLPRLGGYLNPDLERIIKLRPDVVILVKGRSAFEKKLQSLGIDCWVFPSESYQEIRTTISELGYKLSLKDSAQNLLEKIEDALTTVGIKKTRPVKVMLVVGSTPGSLREIYVAGGGSFLNTILTRTGGINVFGEVKQAYFEVSTEEILARQPEIIIDMMPGSVLSQKNHAARLNLWQRFSTVPAIKSSRIFILTQDFLLIPGPRMIKTIHVFKEKIGAYQP